MKSWQERYQGEEATGERVLALWQFDEGAELRDASGKGHGLKLRGQSRIAEEGRFGQCLECFAAPEDKPEGAQVARRDAALSPKGAFTVELWLKPKPAMADERVAWLVDCKYYNYAKDLPRANTGYLFLLRRAGGRWRPTVMLGFGSDSESYQARPVELPAGAWHHLAFTYDGQGTVRILLDGKDIGGGTNAGRGDIQPTRYALTLGGRYGSIHHGTPAFLDQVRISRGIAIRSLAVAIATADGRTAFRRMEKAPPLQVTLTNRTGLTLTGGAVRIAFGEQRDEALPRLEPGAAHVVAVPVDTSLRPDSYELTVVATAQAEGETFEAEESQAVVIAPRPLPNQMPVVMWGGGDMETLKDIGFTHHLVHLADYAKVWEAGRPLAPREVSALDSRREMLNRHLAEGVGVALTVSPGRWAGKQEGYQRINRQGEPYERRDVCALKARVQKFCYDVG
ncbi:MAG: LamG domain-containing protein, partial [Planctomycetota bacterium]